jgi:hypothetical protein
MIACCDDNRADPRGRRHLTLERRRGGEHLVDPANVGVGAEIGAENARGAIAEPRLEKRGGAELRDGVVFLSFIERDNRECRAGLRVFG